jgi:hypothetical protein
MAITVQCTCGKRMGVSDALAGKTIRCSACGQGVFVAPGAAPAAPTGKKPGNTAYKNASGKTVTKYAASSPTVYISKGKIIGLSVIGGIVLLIFLAIVGPVHTYQKWEAMEPQANADVSDIISFGIQAYLSNQGDYDPKMQHMSPHVDGPVVFLPPIMSMSMPQWIVFRGKTTQGNFVGKYSPGSGEVQAEVEYGGYSFGGMVDIAKATGKFNMTGRMASGFPQAEVDGNPIKIYNGPPETPAQ